MQNDRPQSSDPFVLCEPKLSVDAERRSEPRRPAQGRVRVVVSSPEGASRMTPAELTDESVAGLGLVSAVPMQIGDTAEVYPFAQPVATVHAEVVRCVELPGGAWAVGLRRRIAHAIAS